MNHDNLALDALGGRLAHRWVSFGRLLRRNGVATTPAQVRDLLRALSLLDMGNRESVYFASRAILCSRREELPGFDLTFRQFWGRTRQIIIPSDTGSLEDARPAPGNNGAGGKPELPGAGRVLPPLERITLADGDGYSTGAPADAEHLERALLYSSQERLRHLDFARFTEEELALARAIMSSWEWQPGLRRTRRLAPARRGHRLDASRTLRRAMRTEGVPYTLAMSGPRRRPRPIVLLCDISGSMAPYTRMLLYFMHTLRREITHAEVFLFGTRLTRVTRQLRTRDVDQALAEVARTVVDWSGGTRIGESLRAFNTVWARRVLGQGALVCIISDGWDRGEPGLMSDEMAHLQRSAFRLVWLNPLLGVKGYEPVTRGMAAALPYVDDFLPANDLASLEALAQLWSSLDANARPDRRQIFHEQARVEPFVPVPRFSIRVAGKERER